MIANLLAVHRAELHGALRTGARWALGLHIDATDEQIDGAHNTLDSIDTTRAKEARHALADLSILLGLGGESRWPDVVETLCIDRGDLIRRLNDAIDQLAQRTKERDELQRRCDAAMAECAASFTAHSDTEARLKALAAEYGEMYRQMGRIELERDEARANASRPTDIVWRADRLSGSPTVGNTRIPAEDLGRATDPADYGASVEQHAAARAFVGTIGISSEDAAELVAKIEGAIELTPPMLQARVTDIWREVLHTIERVRR
jgi:hypothetical protein